MYKRQAYGYSIGGFDADKFEGDTLTLGVGKAGEPYEGCLLYTSKVKKEKGAGRSCGKNKKASEIFRNLRLLIKGGGYLLSRIALQYHRRK